MNANGLRRSAARSSDRKRGVKGSYVVSPNIPHVALLVETARSFGRDFLSGVARYARLHGPWALHVQPADFHQELPNMEDWGGTGIIARIPNQRVAQAILDADVPTIAVGLTDEQLDPDNPLSKLPEVSSDADQVARLAAEHLIDRQFKYFAYVGMEGRAWSRRRAEAFSAELGVAGHNVHIYEQPKRVREGNWEKELDILAKWLTTLTTPVGLFACNDDRGRQVLEACQYGGLKVPGDVAVLGVDNDAVFCELADPPLSSIALNAVTAGFRAAELLDGMMSGRLGKPYKKKILVEALHVVSRQSTDLVAIEDPEVAAAVQYIRRKQGFSITVDDVAREVAMSRRFLERRFRKAIGRTLLEEIQLARLERAKRLLLETGHPISLVGKMVGFRSAAYFIKFFQDRVGTTPRRFRSQLSGDQGT